MTDEEEFAARSQLKWTRGRRRMDIALSPPANGPVVPEKDHPGMWRSVKVDGILSDTANLSWSKDNVMAQAIREVAWNAANDSKKCPVKRGPREQKSPPMRLNAARLKGMAAKQFKTRDGNAIQNTAWFDLLCQRRRRRTFTIDGTKLDPPAYLAPA